MKLNNKILKIFYILLFFSYAIGSSCYALRPNSITQASPVRARNAARLLLDKELVIQHRDLLKQLSKQQREVLTAIYIEGRTQEEIATKLGIVLSAVSQRKTAGLERLRELVDPGSDYQLVIQHLDLLKQLSKRQREVLTAIYIEGRTQKEITEELGIIQAVVSYRKTAGLERLRELVDPGSDYQLVIQHPDLLAQLTKRQREVLTAIYIDGKTREEIAEELGIVQSAVSHHKTAGLERLRRSISPIKRITRELRCSI